MTHISQNLIGDIYIVCTVYIYFNILCELVKYNSWKKAAQTTSMCLVVVQCAITDRGH